MTVIVISTLSWGDRPGGRFSVSLREALGAALGQDPRRTLYLGFFRSVPLMVLLVFVYNLPQLFPVTQPLLVVPFIAGLVSMTVTEAAYGGDPPRRAAVGG